MTAQSDLKEAQDSISTCKAGSGAARATAVSGFRGLYQVGFRTFARWAAAPHRVFRPENATIGRFEDLFHPETSQHRHQHRAGLRLGFFDLWRRHGLVQTLSARSRSTVLNAGLGTVLFSSYDWFKDSKALEEVHKDGMVTMEHLQKTGAAGAIAGAMHGLVCAPVEVLVDHIKRERGGLNSRDTKLEVLRKQLSQGAFLCLSVSRDAVGIAAFFTTFEALRPGKSLSLRASTSQEAYGPGNSWTSRMWVTGKTMLAGGVAGVVYRCISNPFDVLLVHRLESPQAGWLPPGVPLRAVLLPPVRVLATVFPSSALGLVLYEWMQ